MIETPLKEAVKQLKVAVTTVTQRRHASYPAMKTMTGGTAQKRHQQKLLIFWRWDLYFTTGHLMILIRRAEQTLVRCFLLHSSPDAGQPAPTQKSSV